MGKITEPKPVKLFVGMLSQDTSLFNELSEKLAVVYGNMDMESPVWQWEYTTYYEKEMGAGLKRKFVFFEKLVNPGEIAVIKLKTIELEKQYLDESGGRRINIDPGYLDSAKLVLASTKDFAHRIYLNNGIYGEVTLTYSGNNYQALPYTFPDYRTDDYFGVFRKAREIYKRQMQDLPLQ